MSDTPPHTPVMGPYSMRRKGERKRSPLSQELICAYASSSKEASSSDHPSILPTPPPTTSPSVEGEDADPFVNATDENEHSYHIASHTRSLRRSVSCPLRIPGSGEGTLRFKHLLERLAGEYERDEIVDEILESPDPDGLVREFFEFVRETDEEEMPSDENDDNKEGVEDGQVGGRESENEFVRQNDGDGFGIEFEAFTHGNAPSSANPFTATEYEIQTTQDEEDIWRDTGDWPPNPFKDFFSPDPEPVTDPGPRSTLKLSSFADPNPFSEAVEAMSRARTGEFGENVDTHSSLRVVNTKGNEKEEHDVEGSDILPPLSLPSPIISLDAISTNPFQDPQEEYPYEVGYFSHAVPITEPYGPYLGFDSVESFSQTLRSTPDEDPMNYYVPEAFWQRNEENPYEDPTSYQVTESFSETVLPISEPIMPGRNHVPALPVELQKPQKFKLRNPWSKNPEQQTSRFRLGTSKKPVIDSQPAPETNPEPQIPALCRRGHIHATHQQPTVKLRVRRPPPSPETADHAPAKFPIKTRIKGTISRLSARILPRKQRIPLPVRAEPIQTVPAQPQLSPTPQEAFLASPASYRSLQRRILGDYMRLPPEVRYSQDYGDEPRYEDGVVSGDQTVRRRVDDRRERYRVSERRLQGGMGDGGNGQGEGWRGKYRVWWEDGRAGWGTVYRRRAEEGGHGEDGTRRK